MKLWFMLLALSSTAFGNSKNFTIGDLQKFTLECLVGATRTEGIVATESLLKSILCQAHPNACTDKMTRFYVTSLEQVPSDGGAYSLPSAVWITSNQLGENQGQLAFSKNNYPDPPSFTVYAGSNEVATFVPKTTIPFYTWSGFVPDSGYDDLGRESPSSQIVQGLTIKTPDDMGSDAVIYNAKTKRPTKIRANYKDYVYCLESKIQ